MHLEPSTNHVVFTMFSLHVLSVLSVSKGNETINVRLEIFNRLTSVVEIIDFYRL